MTHKEHTKHEIKQFHSTRFSPYLHNFADFSSIHVPECYNDFNMHVVVVVI